MVSQEIIQRLIDGLVLFATDLLMPVMAVGFVLAVILRWLIYYTVKREDWFTREFDKRVEQFRDSGLAKGEHSFYVLTKRLLEKTYYELFEMRSMLKRRKPDPIMAFGDRVFLIQNGVARLVRSTLKNIKFIKFEAHEPKLFDISKKTLSRNPCFSKVFGVLPAATFNDILNVLPGMFIIGGIFGTFLGIMKALPDLGDMDLNDIEGTKLIMDMFLLKISFSMSTSIVGIVLSVLMKFFNTLFSPEKLFIQIVDRYESSLDTIWKLSSNNVLPEDIPEFDEHRDPVEALAEEALNQELRRGDKASQRKAGPAGEKEAS